MDGSDSSSRARGTAAGPSGDRQLHEQNRVLVRLAKSDAAGSEG